MAEKGLQSSVSDAGVAMLCARAATRGAFLNVQINCGDLEDEQVVAEFLQKGRALADEAADLEKRILETVQAKLDDASEPQS